MFFKCLVQYVCPFDLYITSKVCYCVLLFQESIVSRPHIRELDRPNLKQFCQVCNLMVLYWILHELSWNMNLYATSFNRLGITINRAYCFWLYDVSGTSL